MAITLSKKSTAAELQKLRKAENYREFLRTYLEVARISYSDLARAAGFTRGFPSDVIAGKRRLTTASAFAFEKALKLPAPAKKLFRFLVAQAEPDAFPEIEKTRVLKTIEDLRKKPWGSQRQDIKDVDLSMKASDLLKDHRVVTLFAAAGQPGKGANLEQLRRRTGLAKTTLESLAHNMTTAGLLRYNNLDQTFEPQELHLSVKAKDQNALLKTLFQRGCLAASERIGATPAISSNEMFFSSAFCIDEKRMPELKAALRETILKFVDESISPDGDRVVQFISALHT